MVKMFVLMEATPSAAECSRLDPQPPSSPMKTCRRGEKRERGEEREERRMGRERIEQGVGEESERGEWEQQ